MIKSLRRRHLQTWIILAIILPVGIVIAWISIPEQAKDKLLQPAAAKALPNVLAFKENDNYTVRIRSNNDTSQLQLEWINKKTLTYPTATIYRTLNNMEDDIDHAALVGRIEARGTYYFLFANGKDQIQIFKPTGFHFFVYDFIHQKVIDSITF
ncbi:MAG TPA: hypothetical protein PLA68_08700 [Panacibacter sp.]|nr:hypothetical protein [Panacibacter sp.]